MPDVGVNPVSEAAQDRSACWSTTDSTEIEKLIVELKKNEKSTSEIGLILRDRYSVPDVKLATGKRINAVLKENGLASEILEDLRNLIVKALGMRKHMGENKKDLLNKRQLR